ncbi:MAG: sigma-70 family RNA polymerase sigma factor [Lachnospiraceae bacterium]|nr:sigma-70 family RNA polymerase sigma factor [Lachnospiraceae bacterium]
MDELYREYSKIVYHFLLSICHDAQLAEELTQETFLQAFLSLDHFDNSCKISVWLCQIAKHLFYQYLRKTGREVPTEQNQMPEEKSVGNVEQTAIAKLELMDVLKEMQKLAPQMREVIYLRVMGQLSFKEIGEIMGKSENWARVTFYRGKEQILVKRKEWER